MFQFNIFCISFFVFASKIDPRKMFYEYIKSLYVIKDFLCKKYVKFLQFFTLFL